MGAPLPVVSIIPEASADHPQQDPRILWLNVVEDCMVGILYVVVFHHRLTARINKASGEQEYVPLFFRKLNENKNLNLAWKWKMINRLIRNGLETREML